MTESVENHEKLQKGDLFRAKEAFDREKVPESKRRVNIEDRDGNRHNLKLHEAENYIERSKDR